MLLTRSRLVSRAGRVATHHSVSISSNRLELQLYSSSAPANAPLLPWLLLLHRTAWCSCFLSPVVVCTLALCRTLHYQLDQIKCVEGSKVLSSPTTCPQLPDSLLATATDSCSLTLRCNSIFIPIMSCLTYYLFSGNSSPCLPGHGGKDDD